jgi:hypothetical protein
MALDRGQIVEVNTRSLMVYASYPEVIRELVQHGKPLKEEIKESSSVITPGNTFVPYKDGRTDYYDVIYKKVIDDVTSNESVSIMLWLFHLAEVFRNNRQFFFDTYGNCLNNVLTSKQIARIDFFFPRIDQSTLSIILKICPSTLAGRLGRLAEIGLVARSDLSPPSPKFVELTPIGMAAVEEAANRAHQHMGQHAAHPIPAFHPPPSPKSPTAPSA